MAFSATASYDQPEPRPYREPEARRRLALIAWLLDSAVRVPGTGIRIGADPLLNLIPGLGTLLAKGMSAYLVWEAHRLGVPAATLLRMLGNVGVDLVIGAVPVLGWVGDAFFRSNRRNLALLEAHLDRRGPSLNAAPEAPAGGPR